MAARLIFRPAGAGPFSILPHGLRRGLHSFAASRLRSLLEQSVPGREVRTRRLDNLLTKLSFRPLAPWTAFLRRFAAGGVAGGSAPGKLRPRRLRPGSSWASYGMPEGIP